MTVSAQTVTEGNGPITSAGVYKTPASGRGSDYWGSKHVTILTLSAVTVATTAAGSAGQGIAFDPRSHVGAGVISAVWAVYQPLAATDHQYIISDFDPVNNNFRVWDLTDNDNGSSDVLPGQFVVFIVSE